MSSKTRPLTIIKRLYCKNCISGIIHSSLSSLQSFPKINREAQFFFVIIMCAVQAQASMVVKEGTWRGCRAAELSDGSCLNTS